MRKVQWLLPVLLFQGPASVPAFAQVTGFLPPAHQVFQPLRADPRQLQYAVRLVFPVSHRTLGEAAVGDYLGVYNWALPDGGSFQISAGGGVFGRFDLATASNSSLVTDFYASVPFDLRIKRWSGRMMIYHTSSHLGDDLLATTGETATKHTWDNLRWLGSYDAGEHLRLYGGYTYVFRTLPSLERNAVQAGFETISSWWGSNHAQAYWANDFQSWERNDWNPTVNSQIGIKLVQDPLAGRAVSFFIEYSAGHQAYGQFLHHKETSWNFGVKFDLT